jgi:DNA polymerase III delta prime subunit
LNNLWTEKHRPNTVDNYVFRDDAQKKQVQSWIDSNTIPHLLFSGSAGVGKTTLAKILINQLDVDKYDILEINASREAKVDVMREKIANFVATLPFGTFKIVLLDEADYLGPVSQATLRGLMESYASTARFILTCNYPNKIIPALHSRCQGFHIEKVDQTEFTARTAQILLDESIEFDIDTLDSYVKATYPDLRKCLNMCQMNSSQGVLESPKGDEGGSGDYKFAAVELFKQGNIKKARELLCSSVRPDAMEEVYRWMYDNLDLWGDTDEEKDNAILSIRTGLVNHSFVADPEINLSATLVELTTTK